MTRINTRLRKIEEKKELLKILDEFEEYNTWSAGNEDVMWVRIFSWFCFKMFNWNSSEGITWDLGT